MEQFEDDVTHFESRYAGDKGVFAKFYIHARHNEEKSAKEGRPIFDEMEYVEIFTPGSSSNIIRRPAKDMDRERFKGAYRAFKEMGADAVDGTPLGEVTWLARSQVEELFHSRIRTVEQLAEVADSACVNIPGLFGLRQKAKEFLERARGSGGAEVTKLQAENERLRADLVSLQQTVSDQTAAIQKLTKALEKVKD